MTRARNFSTWAYWRLRLEALEAADPLPDDDAGIGPWRERVRRRLGELVGPWPERVPPDLEVRAEHRHEGHRREEVVFDSERFMSVPANLLVPDGRDAPGPAVLAVHGHGLDKDSVCGVGPAPEAPRADYARQLVRRGFVVLAPDLRGFGERADTMLGRLDTADLAADVVQHHFDCDWPLVCAVMAGVSPLAQNLHDLRCALDVLAAHPLVDPGRIGVAGWSYGGTLALFLAALDERVRAAVVSSFFSSWRAAHAVPWNMCGSQVLWGMLGRIEHLDVAALVAPRALAIESSEDDVMFPAAVARAEVARLRRVYRHLGAPDALVHDVVAGDHAWNGRRTLDALAAALGGGASG
ncbi:MAG: hypothetical protein KatS3mg009_3194 [Acidimicrobiia bacterium]|nr:MAG: hypothetical protein KatS3mg009_3194 [Acidimicrobiia bacterium]